MHDCVVLTSHAGILVPTLAFYLHRASYLISFKSCTFIAFVVAIESALRPRTYSSLRALAHFLERGVNLDHQVSYARPSLACLALNALSLDSSRRNSAGFYTRLLSRVIPVGLSSVLVIKHCLLSMPPACLASLGCSLDC